MSKITLTDLVNLENQTTAVSAINSNNAILETAFDNTLSRDGTSPNQMQSNLDMNSNRILNLPPPITDTEPARWKDIGDAPGYAEDAKESADAARADRILADADVVLTHADVVTTNNNVILSQNYAQALRGTSTTSNTIGTGSKTFITQTDRQWTVGIYLQISSNANPSNYMHGIVTAYSGSTLTVNVTDLGGSGTFTDWNINISGTQGTQGPQGIQGPPGSMGGPVSSVDSQITIFDGTTGTSVKAATNTGMIKASSGVIATATAGTDYLAPAAIGTTVQPYDTNTAKLNAVQTWTKTQTATANSLTSGSGADFTTGNIFTANVNGSTFTVTNPSVAPTDKAHIAVTVTFTTNNTLAFGNKFKVSGYNQSTSGRDYLVFQYDSTADLYYLIGFRNNITA